DGLHGRGQRGSVSARGNGEATQIARGVYTTLTRETQASAGFDAGERDAWQELDVAEPGGMRRVALGRQCIRIVCRRREEIPVDPREVAIDPFLARDASDRFDGGGMTLRGAAGVIFAVCGHECAPAAIERVHEVGRRAPALA